MNSSVRIELGYRGGSERYLRGLTTHVWAGTVDGFGTVELSSPVERDASDGLGSSVVGQGIPPMLFHGVGFRGAPRMAGMQLTVDGWSAKLRRRHLAVTRRGRALRIEVAGRSYRYQVAGGKLRHELLREGAAVTVVRSSWRHPRTLSGSGRGNIDSWDIGLAILLESAYTRNLTFGGAVYSWPGRVLSRMDDLPEL
ncbi:hypothetical protein ACWFQ8_03615 [Streptomyces sp. NPDC055254]